MYSNFIPVHNVSIQVLKMHLFVNGIVKTLNLDLSLNSEK